MQGNVNIPDSTITSALTFRNLVLMNMQQLTNFPYIEKDFDALTDYELLSLVVKYLNDVIANQNEQNDSITSMYESFLALQTYVNNTKDTLEDAFNTLDDYVRNFFDNLDVQDEIDNKLDEYVADGTLEHIIASYLQTQKIYNTFDEMLLDAASLVDGLTVQTLGYHSLNDDGGAFYKITDTESLTEYQEEVGDLYATLLGDIINTKQLGLTGEELDTTSTFQKIIDVLSLKSGTLNIIDGTYMIDGSIGLQMKSNITVNFNNAKLKCIPNNLETTYSIIYLDTIENCIFNNLTLEGDRADHLETEGEYGFGLYFNGDVKNVVINNANLSNFWGDGILLHRKRVNEIDYVPNNLTFNGNINISNCRRQGISILCGENILIDNLICTDINGTNPRACIDLESENAADRIGNIRINYIKGIRTNKCFTMRNRGEITGNISIGTIEQIDPEYTLSGTDELYTPAFRVFFEYFSNNMKKYKITVDNIYQSRGGIEIENAYDITPLIVVNNLYTKVREIVARATPSTSRGIINLLWNIDTELSNTLGNIIINNFVIDNLKEIANTDVNVRPYIINYDGNKSVNNLTLDNVIINTYVNSINSHVTMTNSTSNIIFDNVMIKTNYIDENINNVIMRKNTGNQNQVIEDMKKYYFIPVDDGSSNKTLYMRVLNSLKSVRLYTKGLTTIHINTIYNTTLWEKVFLNDVEVVGTDGDYNIGQFSNDTEFIITTKGKNIYVYSI